MSALPVRGIDAAQHILSIPNPDDRPITLHDLHLILFLAECTVRRQHGLRLISDTFINTLGYPYASTVCEILGPNTNIDRYHPNVPRVPPPLVVEKNWHTKNPIKSNCVVELNP